MEYNLKQFDAIKSKSKKIACVAGPGTGKTRTMVARMNFLLNNGTPASEIMAITFTNKAAQEIKDRLKDKSKTITVGTFHSVFYRLMCQYKEIFGLIHSPTIMDEEDVLDIIRSLIINKNLMIKEKEYRHLLTLEKQELAMSQLTRYEAKLVGIYNSWMMEHNCLDYDKILYDFYLVVRNNSSFSQELRNRFKYVFIDEYQDTNRLQAELIKAINPCNLFVVGDMDQSIYGWRGARIDELNSFINSPETEVIFLNLSYRCPPDVLISANKLIVNNKTGFKKEVYSILPQKEEKSIVRLDVQDEESMLQLIASFSKDSEDMAILCRTNKNAKNVYQYLQSRDIDCLLLTTESEFWENFFIKDFLAGIKYIFNPKDSYSLFRGLRLPYRRWWKESVKNKIVLQSLKEGVSISTIFQRDYGDDILNKCHSNTEITAYEFIMEYMKLFREYLENEPISENKMGMINMLLLRIKNWVEKRRQLGGDTNIPAFLRWLAFRDIQEKIIYGNSRIKIMTIHGAKGLEFKDVIIPYFHEGNIPNTKSDIEEERRLVYVAITRTKGSCKLLIHKEEVERNSIRFNTPSRFLEEMLG